MTLTTMTTLTPLQPSLPDEIIELVLLLVPAMLTRPPPRIRGRFRSMRYQPRLSVAQWIRWAHCILPPSSQILPTSALAKVFSKFDIGQNTNDWTDLFNPANQASPKYICAFLTKWHTKWARFNEKHMFAAFDCALIANRVDVLSVWWVQQLPLRTGLDPEPSLPLSDALCNGAFDAIEYLYLHLTRVQRGPWSELKMRGVFDEALDAPDLIPLLRNHSNDSREAGFAFDWIEKYGVRVDDTGSLVMFACEEGRVDVLNALVSGADGGIREIVDRVDTWTRKRMALAAIENEQWKVLKWWARHRRVCKFALIEADDGWEQFLSDSDSESSSGSASDSD